MNRRGSLSAMVVCLVHGMFMLGALAIDGGRLVIEYQKASDAAAVSARMGAQHITGIMEGSPVVDVVPADRAATVSLASLGYSGSARAGRTWVEVIAMRKVPLPLLSLIGIGSRTISVTRTADAVLG